MLLAHAPCVPLCRRPAWEYCWHFAWCGQHAHTPACSCACACKCVYVSLHVHACVCTPMPFARACVPCREASMDKLRAALADKVVKEERQAARDKQVVGLAWSGWA